MNENNEESRCAEEPDELELLATYIAGAASARERALVEQRLASDPEVRRRLEQMHLLWDRAEGALRAEVPQDAVDAGWERLAKSLDRPQVETVPIVSPRELVPLRRPRPAAAHASGGLAGWQRGLIAASVLLAAGAALWGPELFGPREVPIATSVHPAATEQFVTGPGERRTVTLTDGSRLTLAPSSVVRAAHFSAAEPREVHLEGHAFFEVAHDEARPFLVYTASAVTRVVGTEFDVRAYAGSGGTEVLVRSGAVAVTSRRGAGGEPRLLTSGYRGTVEENGDVQVESAVDAEDSVAWTEGTLAFRAVPLRDVAAELGRWYGVSIRIEDPDLARHRITATFTNESADLVLNTIGQIANARWERTQGGVVFTSR